MDVINLGSVRHFLRERPIRVNVFDRPRLVAELICLEAEQQEARRQHSSSDEFYLVVEGRARLRAGVQTTELEAMDAVLVPPGVEHYIFNPGPGQLTVLVTTTPKPVRANEVRLPRDERPPRPAYSRPRRDFRPEREGGAGYRDNRRPVPSRDAKPLHRAEERPPDRDRPPRQEERAGQDRRRPGSDQPPYRRPEQGRSRRDGPPTVGERPPREGPRDRRATGDRQQQRAGSQPRPPRQFDSNAARDTRAPRRTPSSSARAADRPSRPPARRGSARTGPTENTRGSAPDRRPRGSGARPTRPVRPRGADPSGRQGPGRSGPKPSARRGAP